MQGIKKIIIGLFFIFVLFPIINATEINQFNDSTTENNLTFSSYGIKYAYVTLPKSIYFINASLNLTGYNYPINATINGTNMTYTGVYTGAGSNPVNNCNDTNWDSYCAPANGETGVINISYKINDISNISNIYLNFSIWYNGADASFSAECFTNVNTWYSFSGITKTDAKINYMFSAPENCFINKINFTVRFTHYHGAFMSASLYESKITVEKRFFPQNVSLDIGNDGIYDYNISYLNFTNSPQKIYLNITSINNFLGSCGSTNCNLPLKFTSDIGIINLFNLNISYDNKEITQCSQYSNTTALNFTFKDENSFTIINGSFKAVFTLWQTYENTTTNYTFNIVNVSYVSLCIYPTWITYNYNASIEFYGSGYSKRYYFIQRNQLSNSTKNYDLYLLSDSSSSEISFNIQDIYSTPQANIIIIASRYYTELNEYYPVCMGKSDTDGLAAMNLKKNEWYKFIIMRNNANIRVFDPKYLTEDSIILKFSATQLIEYFNYYNSVTFYCYNMSYPPPIGYDTIACNIVDSSGLLQYATLNVKNKTALGFIDYCTDTEYPVYGIVSVECPYLNLTGKTFQYTLIAKFGNESTYTILDSGLFEWPTGIWLTTAEGRLLGIFIAFLLFITLSFIGIWNPAATIMFGTLGIVVSFMFGLIDVGYSSIASLVVGMGFLVFKLRT